MTFSSVSVIFTFLVLTAKHSYAIISVVSYAYLRLYRPEETHSICGPKDTLCCLIFQGVLKMLTPRTTRKYIFVYVCLIRDKEHFK